MMKRQNKKRGFTIVELTIVVAVIAILSAVLIPTFTGIIKKSRQSADQQAVTTINKVLAGEVVDKPETIAEVIELMAENGYDVEDYKPLSKDTYFYWVKSENAIVIADANDKIIYPAQYENLVCVPGDWNTLTGEIAEDDSWEDTITNDGKVSVSSGEQLVSLMNDVKEGKGKGDEVTTVTLSSDIDLKGSTINFGTVEQALTIEGSNKTIYGLRSDSNNTTGTGVYAGKGYGYGLIPNVKSTVVVKDIVIDGMIVEDTATDDNSQLGFIAGVINAGGDLTIENVTVKNSTIAGNQRVGALVGSIQGGGKLTVKNVTVTDNTIKGNTEAAVLLGSLVKGSITIEGNNNIANNVVKQNDDFATAGHKVVAAPTLEAEETNALSEGDVFCVANTKQVTDPTKWEKGSITQNYYWYAGSALNFATRNARNAYDSCIFSASDTRTVG